MKIYAVIDTNVLVSALLSKHRDSATTQVVELFMTGRIIPLFNDEIISEYTEVLRRPKFDIPALHIDKVLKAMASKGILLTRTPTTEKLPDPKDVVFYEIALSKDGSFLVTGNIKHFPNTPIVVTPAQMLEIVAKAEKE